MPALFVSNVAQLRPQANSNVAFGDGDTSTHHLINPVTHSSASTEAQTVTVIAASGSRAEVLTKRGFVDSPEEFLAWLPSVGGAGLIIFADGSQQVSANWSNYA